MSLPSRNNGKVVLNGKQSFAQENTISLDKCNVVTLLILGDGDFSYSLDWARYLITAAVSASVYPDKSLHLVATGLDSEESLKVKYKDANFLLKGLHGMDKTQRRPTLYHKDVTHEACSRVDTILRVSVHHGVNAIHPSTNNTTTKENPTSDTTGSTETASNNNIGIPRARHVLFHHPHLGTEDAALHAQFLCHLFHSVVTAWLVSDTDNGKIKNKTNMDKDNTVDNNGGQFGSFFHLTLVKGQFERWKCQEAADRHGVVLVDQRPFRSPRVDNSYYKHRRHQSGKSFAARAPEGSVTYTFVPQKAAAKTRTDEVGKLVANLLDLECTGAANNCDDQMETEERLLQCPHCEKRFREERSRKAHIKAVHASDDDPGKKRKRDDGETPAIYACFLCLSKDGKNASRVFQSAQALADHEKAIHTAKHDIIKPDWYTVKTSAARNSKESSQTQQPEDNNIDYNDDGKSEDQGSCEVCGLKFVNRRMKEDHTQVFVPRDVLTNHSQPLLPFECACCKKAFRELRAKRQHENFCCHKPA